MLSPVSHAISQPSSVINLLFSHDLKVNKVARKFFAKLTFAIGTFAFIAMKAPFAFFIGIPCYVMVGVLIWQIQRMKDYEDPIALTLYRTDAINSPLEKTIQEHGWENLFHHKLLTQDQFAEKYRQAVSKLRVEPLLNFYENALRVQKATGTSNLEIPHPKEFQHLLIKEIESFTRLEFLEKYPIERLHQYELVGSKFKEAKETFEKIEANRIEALTSIQKNERAKVQAYVQQLLELLKSASTSDQKQQRILSRLINEATYLERQSINHWFKDDCIFTGDLGSDWGELDYIPEAVEQFRDSVFKLHSEAVGKIDTLDRGFWIACNQIEIPEDLLSL